MHAEEGFARVSAHEYDGVVPRNKKAPHISSPLSKTRYVSGFEKRDRERTQKRQSAEREKEKKNEPLNGAVLL
jgi:hypothetical protein